MSNTDAPHVVWIDSLPVQTPERAEIQRLLSRYYRFDSIAIPIIRSIGQSLPRFFAIKPDLVHARGQTSLLLAQLWKRWQPSLKIVAEPLQQSTRWRLQADHWVCFQPDESPNTMANASVSTTLLSPCFAEQDLLNSQADRAIIVQGQPQDFAAMRRAIWAFDVLRHTDPELMLCITQPGVHQPRLQSLVQQLAWDDARVRFSDNPMLLCQARAAWLLGPHRGEAFFLEATCAASPLVALDQPALQRCKNLNTDCQWINNLDPVEIAKRTLPIVRKEVSHTEQPAKCKEFSISTVVRELMAVYDNLITRTQRAAFQGAL